MTEITIQSLFDNGAHFGHKKQNLHPSMSPYVYINNSNASIIDLRYTKAFFDKAKSTISKIVSSGKKVLFVSTKHQTSEVVKQFAILCKSPYVTHKWLGGMLTNWSTISKSLSKMTRFQMIIDKNKNSDDSKYTKKELLSLQRKVDKIKINLEGLNDLLGNTVGLVVVFDVRKDLTAIKEAVKNKIPVLGIVDTNHDPSLVDYIIPANDDSVNAVSLYASYFADIINKSSVAESNTKRVIKNTSNFTSKHRNIASKHLSPDIIQN